MRILFVYGGLFPSPAQVTHYNIYLGTDCIENVTMLASAQAL